MNALCRRIGEWVVSHSGCKSFSRFPQEAWRKLPEELFWMREVYAEQYLSKNLRLTPGIRVDVQGMVSLVWLLCALSDFAGNRSS